MVECQPSKLVVVGSSPTVCSNGGEMNIKQVIIVRKDLNMRKGKLAAQVAHASLKVLLDHSEKIDYGDWGVEYKIEAEKNTPLYMWLCGAFTKVVLYVDNEIELIEIYNRVKNEHIQYALVIDSGKTEFNNVPTKTCLAVGPDFSGKIDKITGHLKLL